MIAFDDQFEVQASPDAVMKKFLDVEAVARCVPGVTLDGRDAEGNYLGTMTVAFGPKRVKFQGRMKCEFDETARTGVLSGGGAAAGRSAQVQMNTRFAVVPVGAGASRVEITSRTEMHGVLAQFATAGGAAVARQIMEEFAACLGQTLASASAPAIEESAGTMQHGTTAAVPDVRPRELSAARLLWRMLIAQLRAWGLLRSGARSR
jgi:carbon monoxide dehydrogenase subunit G